MIRANSYFFLAGVDAHILVKFNQVGTASGFVFKNENDVDSVDLFCVVVYRESTGFRVDYRMSNNGSEFQHGISDIIPSGKVYGVIAALVNDALQLQK